MLQAIRDKIKGWVAGVIVGLLVIPFAFWGISSYFTGGVDTWVAKVGSYEIDNRSFQTNYQNYRGYMTQVSQGRLSPSYFDDVVIKRQFLEGLIDDQLLIAATEKAEYAIPDGALATQIRTTPGFQVEGVFSPERYQQMLRFQRMTPEQYENRLRRSLYVSKIPNAIRQSEFVLAGEIADDLALQGQERDIRYVIVDANSFNDSVSASDEDIQAYYDENDTEFLTPERVSIEYVELSAVGMMDQVAVTEDDLRGEYELLKDRYILPEERLASHILVEVNEDAEEETLAAAEVRALALVERARRGEDFAALAAENSDDPGAADVGGSLGWLERGGTVPPVEEALFAMNSGDISDPVRSGFGYHVIWLQEIREARGKSFAEVRDELETEFRERTAEDMFFERSDRLFDLSFENPATLEPAAAQLGLEIQATEKFTRAGGPGVAANSVVVEAAFSEDVLVGRNNSEIIDIGTNSIVVLRILEHESASRRPLDEVAPGVRAVIERRKRSESAVELADSLLERVDAGEDLAQLVQSEGLSVTEAGFVGRANTEHDATLVSAVFRLPSPVSGPSYHRLAMSSGNHAVLELRSVRSAIEMDDEARDAVIARRERSMAERGRSDFINTLRAETNVEVDDRQL